MSGTLFRCGDCGELVEEDEIVSWTESYGEQLWGCPHCYGGLEEVPFCEACGEPMLDKKGEIIRGEDYCEDCLGDVWAIMRDALEEIEKYTHGTRQDAVRMIERV